MARNQEPISLNSRKQPTFGDATTGFPTKWRLRNERRNPSVVPLGKFDSTKDLGREASSVLACSAGVFFEPSICSRKRHVETSRREEEVGRTYRKGYYFYSPQSSTVMRSKLAATTILRTRTRFRPPNIRLLCRLHQYGISALST